MIWFAYFSTQCHLRNPRNTSPSASINVFPCSFVMFSAKSFMLERMICANLNMTCCRVKMDVWLHVLNAALDDSTAASISLCVDFGTRVTIWLVAGSCKSTHSLVFDSTNFPSIKSLVIGAGLEYMRRDTAERIYKDNGDNSYFKEEHLNPSKNNKSKQMIYHSD